MMKKVYSYALDHQEKIFYVFAAAGFISPADDDCSSPVEKSCRI
ncbi:MAG: hypothetical protein ABFE02_04115 [Sulfuricella sp.]